MGIAVTEVTGRADMRRFIRYPLSLYAGDPFFVPHLLSERKPFFSPSNPLFEFTEACYLLARDDAGHIVGRTTAHVNRRHNEFWKDRTGFFGFFECVDDPAVARALLGRAEQWLRQRDIEAVRGPLNFSTNEECGFVVNGFDRMPAFMMPYTKPYYPALVAECGYAGAKDLIAYEYRRQGDIPERVARHADRAAERAGAVVRPIDVRNFEADVRAAFGVYNDAWARNWGFVPMTEAQFAHMARELRPIVEPSLALIAEVDGRPIGFSLALPDYNPLLKKMNGRLLPLGIFRFLLGRRRIHRVRVLTMGVVPEHRRRGIEMALIYHTFKNGYERGFDEGEFSWILEDNVLMRRALERFGATATKTYRIFEKPL
jgi:GNAT superfamily N-acetyltransferase